LVNIAQADQRALQVVLDEELSRLLGAAPYQRSRSAELG
jgi:hypothetical protein